MYDDDDTTSGAARSFRSWRSSPPSWRSRSASRSCCSPSASSTARHRRDVATSAPADAAATQHRRRRRAPPAAAQTDVPKAVVSVAPPTQGEPPVRSTHGDWQIRCDTPAGAQSEQCVLMQFVTAEDRDNVGLTVIVLKTADKKARIMRILAPLGVLLPSGLGLKIDDTDMGRAGFVRCLPNGCVAEVILEDKLLEQLQDRQDRDLHHLPDAGGRHRHPDLAQRLRRGLRRAAVSQRCRERASSGTAFAGSQPAADALSVRITSLALRGADLMTDQHPFHPRPRRARPGARAAARRRGAQGADDGELYPRISPSPRAWSSTTAG